MLALAAYEADRCPGCGGSLEEHLSDDWGRPRHVYEVTATRCWRCTALGEQQDLSGKKDVTQPQALLWNAHPKQD